jgi:hypothetical protein
MEKLMAPKITDPNSFLTSLVSKRGKSDLFGVYLTGVTVLADASENYHYDILVPDMERHVSSIIYKEEADWNRLLVETRMNKDELIFPISFHRGVEPVTVYFASEGTEMSCMVFIPTLVVSEFVTEVAFFQTLLKEVAEFAGSIPTSIRFTIGAVSMEWDDLVERGCAREVDVGF